MTKLPHKTAYLSVDAHRARHEHMHEHLDELLADYLVHHREAMPSEILLMDLIKWSYGQTKNPTREP